MGGMGVDTGKERDEGDEGGEGDEIERPMPQNLRKEQNWKKRQRKKQARETAKRKRVEALAATEKRERLEVGPRGEAAQPSLSSELSSHMAYTSDGMTVRKMVTTMRGDGARAGHDTDRVGALQDAACNNTDDGRALEEADEDKYDYGVITGKTKGNVFIHGNYHRYYGYRIPGKLHGAGKDDENGEGQDPRLELLEKGWFHKKRCMDVGCNEGILTLNLVQKFMTATMTAIDLDEYLIKRACVNLRRARSAAAAEHAKYRGRGKQQACSPGESVEYQQSEGRRRKQANQVMRSLSKTWFVHGNMLASKVERGSFDCVTALSVSKWIHLHSGDGGIRAFFAKVRDMLAPGGKFILEPQSWRSYKSAVTKVKRGGAQQATEGSYFLRLNELTLRPDDFCDVLVRDYGFRLVRRLGIKTTEMKKESTDTRPASGFEDRSLLVFVKV